MRKWMAALLLGASAVLHGCNSAPPPDTYTSTDASEDAALNSLRDEDNQTVGAGIALQGLVPDENGHVPMANVQ